MSYTGKAIDLSKFGKQKEVELASERVDLKMDFSVIKKRVDSKLKALNKTHNVFIKLVPKLEQVKKEYESMKNVGKFEEKELDKYYKEYDKKTSELGIDIKTTKFYKEFFDVDDQVGQINDIIDDLKARL